MNSTTLTHSQLRISPLNVRTNEEDAEATSALEASILARGLINRLEVHPFAPSSSSGAVGQKTPDVFGVFAGGRRFRAIGKLIARGELPEDWPIEVDIRADLTDAEITELSLSENILRRDLRPSEIHAAVARAAEQGSSAEEIAAHTGQTLRWARQQLRLGRLAAEIFAAYEAGDISGEQAQAYAATEDERLQRACWAAMQARQPYDRTAHHIRAWLKVGDRELERLLAFVGEVAYRAAGGCFELDLFADGPERGRVTDESLLRQLAEEKLADHRRLERQLAGREDLRFAPHPPQHLGATDWSLSIEPSRRKGKLVLPAGDVLAVLEIGQEGEIKTSYWWASRKAKAAGASARPGSVSLHDSSASEGREAPTTIGGSTILEAEAISEAGLYAQTARAAVKEQHGFTADGLQIARSLRRMILRSLIMDRARSTVPRDYMAWSLLRQAMTSDRDTFTGTRPIASDWNQRDDEPRDLVRDFMADQDIARGWDHVLAEMATMPFMTIEEPEAAFRAYLALDEEEKNVCAAVLAGLALLRSANVPGWRIPAHDALARLLGGSDDGLRAHWTPDAAFVGLLPKMKRLELAQSVVPEESFRSWPKLDDRALTGAVAGALEHSDAWVHPILSFDDPALLSTVFKHAGKKRGPDDERQDEEQDPNVNDQAEQLQVREAAQ